MAYGKAALFSSSLQTSSSNRAPKKPKLCGNVESKDTIQRKSWNIVSVLRNSDTFGKGPRHFAQLPKSYVCSYQKRFKDVDKLPENIHQLFAHAKRENFSLKDEELNTCLENIYDLLLIDAKAPRVALEFYYSEGTEIIADMLVRAFYNPFCDIYQEKEIIVVLKDDIKTVNMMLQLLFLSAQAAPIGLAHLCDRPHLLHLLFSLLVEDDKRLHTVAASLMEELILSEPRMPAIDMRKIACLPALLDKKFSYPQPQEALICHVLATIISVSDSMLSVDTSLQEHDRWLMNNERGILNKANQEFLLSFAPFLEKLLGMTARPMVVELPAVFRDSVRDLRLTRQVAAMYTRHLMESTESPIYQIRLYHEKSMRADAYLLLSMLLTGKCREQMQQNILKYKVISGLEKTVDVIVWQNLRHGLLSDDVDAEMNELGPGTTVKIQYLRLIYSISDHHLHRYLLLSEQELDEMKNIAVTSEVPLHKDFNTLDRSNCCTKNPGLLTQIIEKIKQESGTSYIRFWMTRALEAFLRGTICPIDQLFFIKKGLVEEMFRVLLSNEPTSSEVIQGHFDLLASLMKDNVEAFRKFSTVVNCHGTFQKLCRVIDNNLVDSNMFVRCVVLTIYCFNSVDTKHRDFVENCRILKLYENMTKRIQVIVNLVGRLSVGTLSQENVSCLNTSIIILLVAKKNDELPNYLSSILHYEEDISNCGPDILERLRDLLEFWLEHYSFPFKEKDIKSLEESTGFPFIEWKSLTKDLINDDANSPNSILHHLASVTPKFSLKATLVPSCMRKS